MVLALHWLRHRRRIKGNQFLAYDNTVLRAIAILVSCDYSICLHTGCLNQRCAPVHVHVVSNLIFLHKQKKNSMNYSADAHNTCNVVGTIA